MDKIKESSYVIKGNDKVYTLGDELLGLRKRPDSRPINYELIRLSNGLLAASASIGDVESYQWDLIGENPPWVSGLNRCFVS